MEQSTEQKNSTNLPILGIILALIGLGISFYSLQHHIELKQSGATDAFCNINQTFSCDDVANSAYSEDPWGNPLGLYGIGYFGGLILLLIASLVKDEYRRDTLPTYAAMTGLGVLVSIALFFISYFNVGSLCLSCIGVYGVTVIQALVTFFLRNEVPHTWSLKGLYNGGFYMLIALLATVSGFQILEPMPKSPNFTPDLPKSASEVQELLEKVKMPQIKVDRSPYSGMGEDYRKGNDNAKVVIVEFADYQCPSCRDASRTLGQIANDFGNQVLIVFKNFPLDQKCNRTIGREFHKHACEAAIAARCAGQFGKFWEMHDKIFDGQQKIDSSRLKLWALEVGLTAEQYQECQSSPDMLAKIKADVDQGLQLQVEGTPAIFINGLPSRERSYPALKRRIELLLGS